MPGCEPFAAKNGTALSQSIKDATVTDPPPGDQWLYRVLTANETPDTLRRVPERFSTEALESFRFELVRAERRLVVTGPFPPEIRDHRRVEIRARSVVGRVRAVVHHPASIRRARVLYPDPGNA